MKPLSISELQDIAEKILADNAHDQAEELKKSINNDNAMKNLDRHFEQRGGCFDERDRYE